MKDHVIISTSFHADTLKSPDTRLGNILVFICAAWYRTGADQLRPVVPTPA